MPAHTSASSPDNINPDNEQQQGEEQEQEQEQEHHQQQQRQDLSELSPPLQNGHPTDQEQQHHQNGQHQELEEEEEEEVDKKEEAEVHEEEEEEDYEEKEEEGEEKHKQQRDQEREEEEKHFHVLAVDDSFIDRKLLERLLKVSSYQVTFVDSGDKALEYLGLLDSVDNVNATSSSSSSQSPQQEGMKVNLIMTDYCMPGMSGYDLLKRVKGSYWKDVPVVVMSSENIPSRIRMCLEEGAEEFLLKPLQLSDVEKLQTHLLKSLDKYSSKSIDDSSFNTDSSNITVSNKSNSNSIVSKRKALSPEIEDRRPKMKGLAVV